MKYLGPKGDPEDLATQGDITEGGGAPLSDAAPDEITPDQAGAAGTSSDAARADHVHAINAAAPSSNLTASTTNAEGSSTSFARADHSHAITTGTPGAIQPDDSASAGSSANLARADHRHSIAAAAASSITGTNAEGTSTSFARADHNHALGTGVVGNAQIDDDAVTGGKIADNTVTPANIALPRVRATRTTNLSVSSSTSFSAVTLPSEDFDTDGFHTTVVDNDRITITAGSGVYLLQAGAGWTSNSNGWRAIIITLNGSALTETTMRVPAASGAPTRLTTQTLLSLTQNDILRLEAAQNSASTLNIDQAFLSAVRLS